MPTTNSDDSGNLSHEVQELLLDHADLVDRARYIRNRFLASMFMWFIFVPLTGYLMDIFAAEAHNSRELILDLKIVFQLLAAIVFCAGSFWYLFCLAKYQKLLTELSAKLMSVGLLPCDD